MVFRRFRREEQDAVVLGRSYQTSGPDEDELYDEDDEPYSDEDEDEDEEFYDEDESYDDDEQARSDGHGHGGRADGPWEGSGPWDGSEAFPPGNRVDFGSLLVPARDDLEIRINLADAVTGVSVDVVSGDVEHGGSLLQLQAFAAPKSSGLWDEVRHEIAEEVEASGGHSEEVAGPYGTELHAMVSAGGTGAHQQLDPHRFLGVDGQRWFLRGVMRGPAVHAEQAAPLEELFGDVVVVRGEDPVPPRELLPLQLPEDARRALAEQFQQQAGPGAANPFAPRA